MLRRLLLASTFALAGPAMAQEVNDDVMAPPTTGGMTAPDARDQTAPNLPPGTVPTGIDEETTAETIDHGTMDHSAMDHGTSGSTSVTADAATDASTTGTTGTMTTATTGATAEATTDVTADPAVPADTMATTTADVGTSTTATASDPFTGMGGPLDIQSQWSSFDTIGDGLLSPLEFAGWMASSMGQPMSGDVEDRAVELLNQSADELALVDTNGDWHVSQAELTAASPQ